MLAYLVLFIALIIPACSAFAYVCPDWWQAAKTVPVLGFFLRYWKLILLNVILVWMALNDAVFAHLGSLIYLPAIGSSLLTTTLFLRHLFYTSTLDADAAKGTFTDEWRALDPRTRQILTCAYFGILFIGLALVAASVGK